MTSDPEQHDTIAQALDEATGDYELEWKQTLTEAIAVLDSAPFDVLVLDLSLADANALDTVAEARRASALPIVVIADLGDEDIALQSVNVGAGDYLIKGRIDAATLAHSLRYAHDRHLALSELDRQELRDEVTGLYDRRGFEIHADYYCKLAGREKRDLVMLLIDVVNLGSIVEEMGKIQSERALADAAGVLRSAFRDSDILGRISDARFCVVLTGTRIDAARATDRLREATQAHNETMDRPYQLSLQIGLSRSDGTRPLTLPELMDAADESLSARSRTQERKRLLLVDDDLSILLLGDIMFGDDYEVVTAESAADAFTAVLERQPDAVLLDQSLPDMKGIELVRKLRERKSRVPIIMVTGSGDTMTEVEALQAGADDFVTKPFHEKALRARVENVLRHRPQ